MNRFYALASFCAVTFGIVACEKHPLPGEPPVLPRPIASKSVAAPGERHEGGKTPARGEARDNQAQPAATSAQGAEAAKPADAPKFFPEPSK
jgi:hypothetical protein